MSKIWWAMVVTLFAAACSSGGGDQPSLPASGSPVTTAPQVEPGDSADSPSDGSNATPATSGAPVTTDAGELSGTTTTTASPPSTLAPGSMPSRVVVTWSGADGGWTSAEFEVSTGELVRTLEPGEAADRPPQVGLHLHTAPFVDAPFYDESAAVAALSDVFTGQDVAEIVRDISVQVIRDPSGDVVTWLDDADNAVRRASSLLSPFQWVAKGPDGRLVRAVFDHYGIFDWTFVDADGWSNPVPFTPPEGRAWVFLDFQRSGRGVVVESRLESCEDDMFTCHVAPHQGVVIDPASGAEIARFGLRDGSVAVVDGRYDRTGTWLLIGYDDGVVEVQGRGTVLTIDAALGDGSRIREVAWSS